MQDITFILPLHTHFYRNHVDIVSEYVLKNTGEASVVLLETGDYARYKPACSDRRLLYYFEKEQGNIFSISRLLNRYIDSLNTSYIALWGTDTLVDVKQIRESLDILNRKRATYVIPYKNYIYRISPAFLEMFRQYPEVSLFHRYQSFMPGHAHGLYGGCFMVDRSCYIGAGGENERISYRGTEKNIERIKRLEGLGYSGYHVDGPAYLIDGSPDEAYDKEVFIRDNKELFRICKMLSSELKDEVKNWKIEY